ncbi:MAG: D-glycero-beta-D-manno-heptose-7-phosphate kinase [Armatimonadota bacterium]|nr:D-glycero-beta-D-manno-heptose-7-phosphate kinase [Armatimonadota bacterium]
MPDMTPERLGAIVDQFSTMTVAVVGDIILDRYLSGRADRLSAEAPVPVVDVQDQSFSVGGAANVANNIRSLGARALLFGVVGEDRGADTVTGRLQELGMDTGGILRDPGRPTTTKLRVIANGQQVVRADMESTAPIGPDLERRLLDRLQEQIGFVDAVILEDYNKGLLGPNLIRKVIQVARDRHKIIVVDPKFDNFLEYRGVTLFKPNRRETESVLGIRIPDVEAIRKVSEDLMNRLDCDNVMITLSERGVALLERGGKFSILPARVRAVHDTSGAGDTAVSAVTLALAAGARPPESVTLANYAAGAICEKLGVEPVTIDDILEAIQHHRQMDGDLL